jgi:hypothetical protein
MHVSWVEGLETCVNGILGGYCTRLSQQEFSAFCGGTAQWRTGIHAYRHRYCGELYTKEKQQEFNCGVTLEGKQAPEPVPTKISIVEAPSF